MNTSTAAVFSGHPNQLELWEIPLPELQPGQLLVEILGCTICPSDLHSISGRRQTPVPSILGHEIVGRVLEFGRDTVRHDLRGEQIHVGDRVGWAVIAHCNRCFYCLRGLTQKCLNATKYGHARFRPERELLGGFAGHCLLLAETQIIKLPSELSLESACPASCGTATAVAALELAGELTGCDLLICGAGLLGLTLCALARVAGANQVVCVDPNAERAARSLQFGASVGAHPDELVDWTRTANSGHGFDVAWETSAQPAAFDAALKALRLGGRLVELGAVYPVPPSELHLEQVVRRQLTVQGQHNYAPRHLVKAIEFLAVNESHFPFQSLVGSWIGLADLPHWIAQGEPASAVRLGVRPGSS